MVSNTFELLYYNNIRSFIRKMCRSAAIVYIWPAPLPREIHLQKKHLHLHDWHLHFSGNCVIFFYASKLPPRIANGPRTAFSLETSAGDLIRKGVQLWRYKRAKNALWPFSAAFLMMSGPLWDMAPVANARPLSML